MSTKIERLKEKFMGCSSRNGLSGRGSGAVESGLRAFETAPQGVTVAEIIATFYPGAPECGARALRVTIDDNVIDPRFRGRLKPKAGRHVVIRPILRGATGRAILTLIATIAAVALGQYYAVPLTIIVSPWRKAGARICTT